MANLKVHTAQSYGVLPLHLVSLNFMRFDMIEEIDFSVTEVTDENSLDFEEIAADESDLKFDIEFIDEINTDSDCLILFSKLGTLRNSNNADVSNYFIRAFAENPDLAIRIMFYARDIREGLGERKIFRQMLRGLCSISPESIVKNLDYIAEYGRYDDLLCLLDTCVEADIIKYINTQLQKDLSAADNERTSLLAKWLPSVNARAGKVRMQACGLAKALNMTKADYRKALAKLRKKINIIENHLREKDYSIDYQSQTSLSMLKYRNVFLRNDKERFERFQKAIHEGKAKINTRMLFPYEVVRPILKLDHYKESMSEEERQVLNTIWNNLPDYTCFENSIVLADNSGSMYDSANGTMPACVAISLAIYFAERNKGTFANKYLSYNEEPTLINIKGSDIYTKVKYCKTFKSDTNITINNLFRSILNAAIKQKATKLEMPTRIYVITDNDQVSIRENLNESDFESARALFKEKGYHLPQLVFWNLNKNSRLLPIRNFNEDVAFVSGCSPTIFKNALNKTINPYNYMLDVLSSERYARIVS